MSRAEIAQERAAYTDKFFSCAESPIQEWIAAYIGKPVTELFSDYRDESDVIGFMHDSKHYNTYVVTMSADSESLVDANVMKVSEKARKACSMLYDAVREVFMAVTGSLAESLEKSDTSDASISTNDTQKTVELVKSLMPVFVEAKMAFAIKRVNRKAMQLQAAQAQRTQLLNFLRQAPKDGISVEQKELIQETFDQLNKVFTETTQEALDAEEKLCKETNAKSETLDWMHIVLEESDPNDVETINESMKRLPMFGLQFQDPDEENYIDKLKKEQNINE